MPDDEILEPTEDPTDEDTTPDENEDEEDDPMSDTPLNQLKRSALLHYVNANFDTVDTQQSPASWFLIGKHVSDMSIEMNPDTETVKNILDETSIVDNGYEPSFDVDTYYANPSDGTFYTNLKDIVMNRKTGDDCKTLVLEVLVDKADGTGVTFDAWVEEVIVKPTSYGGAQGGVRIPYKVSFTGNRVAGCVTFTNKVPTFSPAST